MSRVEVGTAEAGRPCPACRFPLRHGTVAERCDACGALHHEECWREAGGCAVEGCAGGQTAVMPAAAPPPVPPAAAPPPPPPPPAAPPPPLPPAAAPASNRGVALGLLVGLALAGAALAGYLVARGGGEETPGQRTVIVSTGEQPPPAPPEEPEEDPQHQAMEGLAQIVRFSLLGRTAVREGRYAEAIANREVVLQRLDDLDGARGAVARAQATLRAAMEASLASDRAYADGRDASATDRAATAYKREFVAQWNPLAARYGLEPYAESEI